MNSDKAKGKANEIAGRIERKVGQLTGSKKVQLKGAVREAKGDVQQAKGDVKDAAKAVGRKVQAKLEEATSSRSTPRTRTIATIRTRSK